MLWTSRDCIISKQLVMSNSLFAQNGNSKGLTRVCQVSEQRDVLKRHSFACYLSLLSCFFCLDSLGILTWISESELGHINSTSLLSQQIVVWHVTCGWQYGSFSFMRRDIIMCLASNERRGNALDNDAYSMFQSCARHLKISYW